MVEMSTKLCEKGRNWLKLGENAISGMWKKHQNLPSNNNDGQGITKYGSLVRPDAQIVALRLSPPPRNCDSFLRGNTHSDSPLRCETASQSTACPGAPCLSMCSRFGVQQPILLVNPISTVSDCRAALGKLICKGGAGGPSRHPLQGLP